jgi:hypothetical protein
MASPRLRAAGGIGGGRAIGGRPSDRGKACEEDRQTNNDAWRRS